MDEPAHALKCFLLAQLHNKFTEADFSVNLGMVYKSLNLSFIDGKHLYLSVGHY